MSLGENLKQARERKGVSQAKLAETTDLSVYTISRIECGATVRPQRETVEVLASALDVSVDDLLADNGRPERVVDRRRRPRVAVGPLTFGPWKLSVSEDMSELHVQVSGLNFSIAKG